MQEWRTSSYTHNGGNCVEVADDVADHCHHIRDTRHRELGVLTFPASEWRAFLQAVRSEGL